MTSDNHPAAITGLRHVALQVNAFDACCAFYSEQLGMTIEWRPDEDTAFLTFGDDNLALHRASASSAHKGRRLDHIGFVVDTEKAVDRWYDRLRAADATTTEPPKAHRDGSRSFFCRDPDGTKVQILYHPTMSRG